jgi:uncharacterized protein involved in exopolysaccharide biosynthesis
MPEDRNWEMERPLSTTPEAAILRQIFKFVFENCIWLAGGVVAGVLLGLIAQDYLPVTYEAEGSFAVNEVPFLQKSARNNNQPDHDTENDLVQSLILGIPSLNMRSVTAAHLGIAERQICFEDISSRPLSLKSKELVANIRVGSVRNSRTGTISVRSQSAEFAAQVANTLLDELCNYNLAQGRLNGLDLDVQFALSRSESIQTQLASVEQARNWQEQQVAQLDEYQKQGLPLESFPDFVADITLNNLKTERLLNRADYAGLASTSSGGLQLENKKAQVADVSGEIKQQAQSLADGQRSQLVATKVQEQNLLTEQRDTLEKIQRLSREREEWVQSFGDIANMEKMIASDTNSLTQRGSTIVMVNRAIPAERAKSPKLWLNLLVGIFVGGLAGLLVAVTRTLLDDRLVSPKTVSALTNLPCVATIPRPGIFSWKGKNPLARPPARTGFNQFRSRLLLTAPGAKIQIIGFTPARKRESASQAVADLAIMLARAGRRTLVVDLHFSKPRQYSLLGIKPQRGLADWMASSDAIENFVWPAKMPELALLSCEPHKKLAGDLMARRPLARILPQFDNLWEFILIDAPAISSCWDLMLALPAESTLIITARRRRTRARQVVQTAFIAQNQNWNVAGVALQGC